MIIIEIYILENIEVCPTYITLTWTFFVYTKKLIYFTLPRTRGIFIYISHLCPGTGAFSTYIFELICPEFGTITNSIVPNSGYRCFCPYNWDYPQPQASNTTFSQWNSSIPTEMKITLSGIRTHVVLKQIVERFQGCLYIIYE